MSRTFQDENFLVWEVYPSGSNFGFSDRPNVIFHCLTDRGLRARALRVTGDEADAERLVVTASAGELLELLKRAEDFR
jgi:hypothetical protein